MASTMEPNTIVYIKRDADEGKPVGPPKLWMLIEYRTQSGANKQPVKNYEVIDAKDAFCGTGGRGNTAPETMHTGKIIYVKKDSSLVQATIVTISDDKNFLDTEQKDMIELQKNENQKKRKRVATPKMENNSPPPAQYQRWSNHDASTSLNGSTNKQSVIISNPNVQNYPPMTFDQQTQTDFKPSSEYTSTDSRLNKILMNEENILRSQHNISADSQDVKQQVAALRAEVAEVKTILKDIASKLGNQNDGVHSTSVDFSRNGSVLNSTQNSSVVIRTPHTNPPRILNLAHQTYTPQTIQYNSISIEPVVEASNDSNFSYSNNSRMSLSASNQSIYQADTNHSDSGHTSASKLDHSNTSRSAESFAEDDGNPTEEVVIGNNNTTVPRSVLLKINWNSHTAATRKLLLAKFSREVLATHSLTGKPSPAFMDSSKPTKNQLNPSIIADIVQYVTKRCRVTDTAVRSSITTKCADENKMMRQRNDKNRKTLEKIENKENFKNRNNTIN